MENFLDPRRTLAFHEATTDSQKKIKGSGGNIHFNIKKILIVMALIVPHVLRSENNRLIGSIDF